MTAIAEPAQDLRALLAGLGSRRRRAPLPVNAAQILQFCDAIGDDNPIYRDADAARRFGFPGQVAPPAMAHSWTMPPLRPGPEDRPLLAEARRTFGDHGFDAVIATNYMLTHRRYFAVGETVTETTSIESVSDLKETPVGIGHFLTSRHDFAGEDGAVGASLGIRVFHFRRPAGLPAEKGRSGAPRSAVADDGEGRGMPPFAVDITPTLIIAGAIGSGDFEPVHHDVPLARSQGLDDIIMNILTTAGLVSRYVTDQAGPSAILRSISLVLKAPNYPGDRMILSGRATGNELAIRGRNRLGDHVAATVVLDRKHDV